MSKVNLILVLNKVFKKVRKRVKTCFSSVKYTSSEVISVLLTEKTNARLLISWLLNTLIQAAKTINTTIVGIKILKHWQSLKVYGILLNKYLGVVKMKLLKQEIKSAIGIQLKTFPR